MVSAEKMTFSLEPNLYNFCYKFFFVHLMYSLSTLIFLVLFYSSTVFADSTHENKTEPQSGKNLNELSKKIDPTDSENDRPGKNAELIDGISSDQKIKGERICFPNPREALLAVFKLSEEPVTIAIPSLRKARQDT